MVIIQDESRLKNVSKLYEMQTFFDDEDNLLGEAMKWRNIYRIIHWIGFFFLIGLMIILSPLGINVRLGLSLFQIILIGITGIACEICAFMGLYQSNENDLLSRYNSHDMFLYWLLEGCCANRIVLNRRHNEATIYRNDLTIQIPVEGFSIKGSGVEVHTVNLDKNILFVA